MKKKIIIFISLLFLINTSFYYLTFGVGNSFVKKIVGTVLIGATHFVNASNSTEMATLSNDSIPTATPADDGLKPHGVWPMIVVVGSLLAFAGWVGYDGWCKKEELDNGHEEQRLVPDPVNRNVNEC